MRFSLTSGVSASGGTLGAEVKILALNKQATVAAKSTSATTDRQMTSTRMMVSSEPAMAVDGLDNS